MSTARFEIQHCIGMTGAWENCWSDWNDVNERKPVHFDSVAEAQAELDEFLDDANAAGIDALRCDYRIVAVEQVPA